MAKKTVVSNPRRQTNASVPSEAARIPVHVSSDIIDTYGGLSQTELVWTPQVNVRYIRELFNDQTVKTETADFFVNRSMAVVIGKMVKTPFMKPQETAFTKKDLFDAVSSFVKNNVKVCGAIVELSLPMFVKMGLVSNSINYSMQVSHGFDRVTVENIRDEVSMYQVTEQVKKVDMKIDGSQRISATVFAEEAAEALRSIGLAIHELVDMSGVVDDLVRGVRAHIDPTHSISSVGGSVPHDWRNHRVVADLSTNLVFVRAALALPKGYSMALRTDSWKLDNWASVVMTALQSSERYRWVSKAEALKHYSLRKIRDVRGVPVSAVLARWVETAPVAQAVFAVEDMSFKGAYNIDATKDRIADSIQAAYGKANFSLLDAGDMLANNLQDYVEAGWTGASAVYVVDASGNTATLSDIAALMADTLYVSAVDGEVEVAQHLRSLVAKGEEIDESVWEPAWWYGKLTSEKSLQVWSGRHMGDRIMTNDAAEVILASADKDAVSAVPSRPQLLSPAAFNTRLLAFNRDLVQEVSSRFSFNATIAGISVAGAFRAVDFASLRSGVHTSVVVPHYNAEVISGYQKVFTLCTSLDSKVAESGEDDWTGLKPDVGVTSFINARAARELLRLAQKLDPSFRNELHMMIIERALVTGKISGSEADLFRAKLSQKSFAAVADLIALQFFLFVQGINTDVWTEMLSTDAVYKVCMELGSDRG